MGHHGRMQMIREQIKAAVHITGSLKPVDPTAVSDRNTAGEDGIDYGLIILPPIEGEYSEEMSGYPQDYIEYAQGRLRFYKEQHGELPTWERQET